MAVDYEIHLEFRAETIIAARQFATEVLNVLTTLKRVPDSSCISFSAESIQKEYEDILMEELNAREKEEKEKEDVKGGYNEAADQRPEGAFNQRLK